MFIVKMADHDGNHRCLEEKNVPIALILSSRWRDGAESLGMESTSCLYQNNVLFCRNLVPILGLLIIDLYGVKTKMPFLQND